MPRPTTYVSRGGIYIPQVKYEPLWKITIVDDDSVTHTLLDSTSASADSNKTLSASFTRVATDSIGSFSIVLTNNNGEFLRKFNGGETVDFYLDFSDATTRRFRGKVDNVKYGLSYSQGWIVKLDGRDYPELADDVTIIQYANKNAVDCLKGSSSGGTAQDSEGNWNDGILYNTGIRWDPANTVTSATAPTAITKSYQNVSYWEIISDICNQANLDCYVYFDGTYWNLRVFVSESVACTTDYIAFGDNLSTVGDFGTDNNKVKNKIIVYGKDDDNVITVATEEDTASQTELWTKAEVVSDSNIELVSDARLRAVRELANKKDSPQLGRVTALVLTTLNPGETLRMTIPYCNVDGYYIAKSFTSTYDTSGAFTSVEVSKRSEVLADIIKEALDIEKNVTPYKNLNNMKDSLNLDFDDTRDTWLDLSNCETVEGVLRLNDGESTGTCTTRVTSTVTDGDSDYNITQCELRIKAINYKNCTYEVSNDNGTTWESLNPGVLHTFTSNGSDLRVRITLNTADNITPEFEAVGVLYK